MVPPQTQVQAPVRSLDQRMEALKRANDIRVKRAQLKKDLKVGTVRIEAFYDGALKYGADHTECTVEVF